MGDPWTKCPRPPGPAEEGAPNPKGKSDGRGTKRHLVLGRQGRGAVGPSLAQHWSAAVMTRPRGALISLSWIMVGLEAGPRLSQAIAPLWLCSLLWHFPPAGLPHWSGRKERKRLLAWNTS